MNNGDNNGQGEEQRVVGQQLHVPPLPPLINPHLLDEDGNIPEHMRIQDFDAWLDRNALLDNNSNNSNEEDTMDRREEVARFQQEEQYQRNLHSAYFQESKEEAQEKARRRRLLDAWRSLEIDIKAGDGTVIVAPLSPMAESCDTVFVVALSWHRGDYHDAGSGGGGGSSSQQQQQQQQQQNDNKDKDNNKKKRKQNPSLSIDDHPSQAILYFVDLVLGKIKVDDLPSDMVVDCCQIAHYLQCAAILDEIVAVLQNSIDTNNCYSLTQLADQLNLPTLLERSLSHMMDSLGNVTAAAGDSEDGGGQEAAVAEYLTPELQRRIASIQAAIQSSIHSQRSRLYFASLEEYLAIFAERVQYYRERLAQAKEQQQHLLEEDQARQQRANGRFVTLHLISNSKCYQDTQAKIEKQEARLRTLEIAYTEQKKLFANNNDGSTKFSSSNNNSSENDSKKSND